ncbi:unnamed protein product [Dicrocoelium dendriticum]|nr:unnamed protein product [Dicrocoelium dendriticum]
MIVTYEDSGVVHFRFIDASHLRNQSLNFPILTIAAFQNLINDTGWSSLQVTTSQKFADHYQAYWAGFLEANITRSLTEAHWLNTVAEMCQEPLSVECKKLKKYLSANVRYVIEQFFRSGRTDEFWYQVGLQMWQLKGISDAYAGRFVDDSRQLTRDYLLSFKEEVLGIYLLQLSGDLGDITEALKLKDLQQRKNKFGVKMVSRPSCSALIKLVEGDVFLSHVTWSPYTGMLRVLKHYNFPWKVKGGSSDTIPGHSITFSSYPSVISSVDDFYITSAKLVTMETTIGNSNDELWPLVKNGARSSVLEPFRVMLANRLAVNGQQWVSYFQKQNSGTYNNQWMIFDANLYSPDKPLPSEALLTVAEQIPGMVYYEDVTHVLRQQTYWPSYNIPCFPVIYNASGYLEKRQAKYGEWYDYDKTARAQMFRRDHHTVRDIISMHKLMRYNDFKHDPLSKCDCKPPYTGENGISARSDLNDPNGRYGLHAFEYRLHGGTDVKIVNYTMVNTINLLATSGPTYDDQPPFEWSKVPHLETKPHMHPDLWRFAPILTNFMDYELALDSRSEWNRPKLIPVF